ncbi:hypothetical protein PMG11_06955 [Penicillium brasilianum]|uniref:Zn(2)-C6 fungal-type domain-containing protein n=1 Tax=Penicillium brasilianum TaxID=104259 RepID=A0A0F7TR33_PENBI|nr:hypothetical protein PMG11_06955 [Penicillium brasilianum]
MSPTETKAKIRPQQSCLKCRERKVKCDRNIPCEACIHRGIESECTYLTSAEDRAHISQAEIIDRLRREVAQLRTRLNQSSARGPSPGRRDKVYARKNKPIGSRGSYATASGPGSSGSGSGSRSATGSAEPTEAGSWAGSSPSSISTTTRTNSVTVTSPDSTGSDSGVGGAGYVQQQAYPGSTTTDNTAVGSYLNDDTIAQYHAGNVPAFAPKIPGSTPMQGFPPQAMQPTPDEGLSGLHMHDNRNSPRYDPGPAHAHAQSHMASYGHGGDYNHPLYEYTNVNTFKHDPPQPYPSPGTQPWSQGYCFPQLQSQRPLQPQSHHYPDSTYYSSTTNTFPPTESTIHPYSQQHQHQHPHQQSHSQSYQTTNPTHTYSPPTHPTEYQTRAINSIPDSWKGPDKQALLETLLETITSCDEERVAQVVAVVRTSETPEEAVSGICQVLGISGTGDGSGASLMR